MSIKLIDYLSISIGSVGLIVSNWTRMETVMEADATNHKASLQITTSTEGVVWLDQVSAMPLDTYKVSLINGNAFKNK